MLRIGLTGDLGSGKSTVARMLAERGAILLSSDDMARTMMQPGQPVFRQIVDHFGPSILSPGGALDRHALANLAFDPAHTRVEELNAIIHPAVIAAQNEQLTALARAQPHAIAVVESALIFSTRYAPDGDWHSRFDRILLVTAPKAQKIARFIARAAAGRNLSADERSALETDARHRLALQHTEDFAPQCIVLNNDSSLQDLELQVDSAWQYLRKLDSFH